MSDEDFDGNQAHSSTVSLSSDKSDWEIVDSKWSDERIYDPAHESACPLTPRDQSDPAILSVPLSAKETGSGNLA
jgi:hypothetical protein